MTGKYNQLRAKARGTEYYCINVLLQNVTAHDPYGLYTNFNIKNVYCRHHWEPDQYTVGMVRLEEVVCQLP